MMTCASLPDCLPIFPLAGALLLPEGQLPLRIFEPRYQALLEDVIGTHQLIGMIKPRATGSESLYDVGCAGRIISCEKSKQGSAIILLQGVSRFRVKAELDSVRGYRQVQPEWLLEPRQSITINRARLLPALQKYLGVSCPDCDWQAVAASDDTQLMTCLSMLAPLSPAEQQALLEVNDRQARADMLVNVIELTAHTSCGASH